VEQQDPARFKLLLASAEHHMRERYAAYEQTSRMSLPGPEAETQVQAGEAAATREH
jgi:hypothetical protein